jgi:hypothetical protein
MSSTPAPGSEHGRSQGEMLFDRAWLYDDPEAYRAGVSDALERVGSAATDATTAPEVGGHEHRVGFYDHEEFLVQSVVDFLAPALESDEEGVLIVATPEHRERFAAALLPDEADLERARRTDRIVMLDAEEGKQAFMRRGSPDPRLFKSVVDTALDRAARGGRPVRVYGEIVALLFDEDNVAGALALEELWNRLARTRPLSVYCAYPMSAFAGEGSTPAFLAVCQHHSAVTNESYAHLWDAEDDDGVVVFQRRG